MKLTDLMIEYKTLAMNNNRAITIVGFMAVIAAMALSAVPVFWSIDFIDSFYLGCQYLYADSTSAFLPLTKGLYWLTYYLLGDYAISYRLANWGLYVLAYVLGFGLLCGKEAKRKPALMLLLALSILLIPITHVNNAFSGNSISTLFVVLAFVATIKLNEDKWGWYVLLGAAIALGTLARFPNIVVVPMVLLVGLMTMERKQYWKLLAALGGGCAAYLLASMAIFGGAKGYMEALTDTWTAANAESTTDHSVGALMVGYLNWLKDSMSMAKYLSLITLIPLVCSFFKHRLVHIAGVVAFVAAEVAFILSRVRLGVDEQHLATIILYGNVFVATYALSISAMVRHDIKAFGMAISLLLISVCAAAGSEAGLTLMSGPLFALLPWLVMHTYRTCRETGLKSNVAVVLGTVFFAACSTMYIRIGLLAIGAALVGLVAAWIGGKRLNNWHLTQKLEHSPIAINGAAIAAVVIGVVLGGHSQYIVTDDDFITPMREMHAKSEIPMLKWLGLSDDSKEFIDQVMADYEAETAPVEFFGFSSTLFCYVTGQGMIDGVDFAQEASPRNLKFIEDALGDNTILYLIPDAPAAHWYTLDGFGALDSMMTDKGYSKVVNEKWGYAKYYPATEQ